MTMGSTTGSTIIVVNGKRIELPGGHRSLSVTDNGVYVDGKLLDEANAKPLVTITITVNGDVVGPIEVEAGQVEVKGNVTGGVKSTSGDITVHGISDGNAKSTSGNINVTGNVERNATSVSGDVKVSGDIRGSASSVSGNVRGGNGR